MNLNYFNLVLLLVSISYTQQQTQKLSKIKTKGRWFVDDTDRIILFRGVNAVQKEFPWIPNEDPLVNMTNTTLLSLYKSWGYNSVRLGFMWSGLYPEKGQVNMTYVSEMLKIIDLLEYFGMYVIIDLHQDMMSTKFNSYDGVPLWVLNEMPKSEHPFPWPLKNVDPGSFSGYITEECGFSFQCLYKNVSNTETYFHEYWATVAQILKGRSSVLAYELINEPWAGDVYGDPLIFLPGVADGFNLMGFYDRVHPVIRKYDNETLIMYEPVTWGTFSNKDFIGTGFDHPPGYDPNGTVFSWHYYCWLLEYQAINNINPLKNDTLPNFSRFFCNDWQMNTYFDAVESNMKKLGGGASFLTEFGWCAFPQSNGTYNLEACEAILNGCDQHFQSWTYWDTWTLVDHKYDPLVNSFTRVYPMATNGIPLTMIYNSTTRYFFYIYELNLTSLKQAIQTTDIFIPQYLYPNGFSVSVSNNLDWRFDPITSKILLYLKNKLINNFRSNQNTNYVYLSQASVTILSN